MSIRQFNMTPFYLRGRPREPVRTVLSRILVSLGFEDQKALEPRMTPEELVAQKPLPHETALDRYSDECIRLYSDVPGFRPILVLPWEKGMDHTIVARIRAVKGRFPFIQANTNARHLIALSGCNAEEKEDLTRDYCACFGIESGGSMIKYTEVGIFFPIRFPMVRAVEDVIRELEEFFHETNENIVNLLARGARPSVPSGDINE